MGEVVNDGSGHTSGIRCYSCLSRDCNFTIIPLVFQEKQRQNMLGVTSEQRSLFATQQINQFQGKERRACYEKPGGARAWGLIKHRALNDSLP